MTSACRRNSPNLSFNIAYQGTGKCFEERAEMANKSKVAQTLAQRRELKNSVSSNQENLARCLSSESNALSMVTKHRKVTALPIVNNSFYPRSLERQRTTSRTIEHFKLETSSAAHPSPSVHLVSIFVNSLVVQIRPLQVRKLLNRLIPLNWHSATPTPYAPILYVSISEQDEVAKERSLVTIESGYALPT